MSSEFVHGCGYFQAGILPVVAPNNGTSKQQSQQPQHFWQKPGCMSSLGVAGGGFLLTLGESVAIGIAITNPEMIPLFEGAEGVLTAAHIGPVVAAPVLTMTAGIESAWTDCQ